MNIKMVFNLNTVIVDLDQQTLVPGPNLATACVHISSGLRMAFTNTFTMYLTIGDTNFATQLSKNIPLQFLLFIRSSVLQQTILHIIIFLFLSIKFCENFFLPFI